MELRHIRYFLALAEESHFGKAAARAHVVQPALSQQIKQLENELGIELFARTTRRVELTEAGHRFAVHARSMMRTVGRAEADMTLLAAGHAGRVSIGFIGTATYDILPRVAQEVRERLPGVLLELRGEVLSPQLIEGLADETFDLAIMRPDAAVIPEISVQHLRSERLVAVLPSRHPLAQEYLIDLAQLANESFVMHPSGHRSSMHTRVLEACADAGFTPSEILEVSETATLVVFVAAGLGVALVPETVRSLGLDGVTYVALSTPPIIELALASRSKNQSSAIRRVAEIVISCIDSPTQGAVDLISGKPSIPKRLEKPEAPRRH